MDLLTDSGETKRSPSRGTANLNNITVGDRTVDLAARVWNESKIEDVMGYVSFDWKAMDEFPPSFNALMHFEARVVAEQHQRRELLRHAEAELGHQPEVWPYLDVGSTP